MARYFREDFDRYRSFVVKRPFTYNGYGYMPGQLLDKSAFTVRRLRQLYDMHAIAQTPVVDHPSNGAFIMAKEKELTAPGANQQLDMPFVPASSDDRPSALRTEAPVSEPAPNEPAPKRNLPRFRPTIPL